VADAEVLPREQDFLTVGHLYRGIAAGLRTLVDRLGERAVFVGPARAQASAATFRWPELVTVTDLASGLAAVGEIIEQGEGARGDWRSAHYGQFLAIWTEWNELRAREPGFEPARPVLPAFTRQPFDSSEPRPVLSDPTTQAVAELFNLGYEVLLHLLVRYFTHTDETDAQLDTLIRRSGLRDVLPDEQLRAVAGTGLGVAGRAVGCARGSLRAAFRPARGARGGDRGSPAGQEHHRPAGRRRPVRTPTGLTDAREA